MNGLAAVILAGGRSSRMGGGDKTLLELSGKPVLSHIIRRLAPQVDRLAINANGDPARFPAFGLPILQDASDSFDGPLAGLLAGLVWAGSLGATRMLTVAGDTPFFPDALPVRMAQSAGADVIAVAASTTGVHPTFAIWPVAVRADLESQLAGGMRRVTSFIARHPSIAVDFADITVDGERVDPFFNINTPDDLALARRLSDKLLT